MVVRRNGWLYVSVTNESNQNVYFDDLVINHKHGPVLEETNYYPFGLIIPGISTKASKGNDYAENRRKYNGIEYNNDLSLDLYDAFYRNLDPEIGRWWQIDPKVDAGYENISPYASMYDDPIKISDPLGDEGAESNSCCKGLWDGFMTGVNWINENINPLTPIVETVTGKAFNDGKFDIDKPREQSATEAAISLIPGGKIEGAAAKALEKAVVKEGEQAGVKAIEKRLATTEPKLPSKTVVKEGQVDIVHYTKSGDHGPAHLHVKGGGAETRIGQNGKPLKGSPALTNTQQKVVTESKKTIRKAVRQIMKWHKYNNQ